MKRGFALTVLLILIGAIFLAACSSPIAYPQIIQLNGQDISLDWEKASNPSWEPTELKARVLELAERYRDGTDQHVCWDMAFGLREILEANGIASIIAVSKTWTESWDEKSLVLSHVWLIVLGRDSLIIPIEYGLPRLEGDHRYPELLMGYLYNNPEEFEAEYPDLTITGLPEKSCYASISRSRCQLSPHISWSWPG